MEGQQTVFDKILPSAGPQDTKDPETAFPHWRWLLLLLFPDEDPFQGGRRHPLCSLCPKVSSPWQPQGGDDHFKNSIWIVVYHLQNTLETLWRYCPFWSLVASPPSRISRGRKLIFIFSFFLTIYSIYSGAWPWPCANAPTTLQENLDLIS